MKRLHRRCLFIFSFILILFWAIFTTVRLVNVDAQSNEQQPLYKYYKSYEIQPGDTLTSIAETYTANTQVSVKEYINEIRENNHLYKDTIISGKKIVVAYYSNEYK